jgi:hypothetical protein
MRFFRVSTFAQDGREIRHIVRFGETKALCGKTIPEETELHKRGARREACYACRKKLRRERRAS